MAGMKVLGFSILYLDGTKGVDLSAWSLRSKRGEALADSLSRIVKTICNNSTSPKLGDRLGFLGEFMHSSVVKFCSTESTLYSSLRSSKDVFIIPVIMVYRNHLNPTTGDL